MEPGLLDHAFMRHALMAGALAGACCGMAGVFAVLMRLTFIGVCLAHAAFAGGLAALLIDGPAMPGAFAASLLAAAAIGPLAERGDVSPDTAIGIVFSAMLGLAILCLGLLTGPRSEALGLFWGNILTTSRLDVAILAGITLLAGAVITFFFKEIQAVACHRDIAAAAGLPATAIFHGILLFTGCTVTACLPSVGGLLVYSLLVTPAAAAYQLTYSLRRMFQLAALFGAVSCEAGLLAAWRWDLPAGAAIVLASTLVFLAAAACSPKRRQARRGG